MTTLREERARAVQHAKDVRLPRLRFWNYSGCPQHPEPKPDCEFRACGGEMFSHQRVGVMWLYLRQKGLLADLPGVGKTHQVLGLAALLKERGELGRMIVICQTPAALQWFAEAQRWVPNLQTEVIPSKMAKDQRIERYIRPWDLLIIGYHMMLRDWLILDRFDARTWAIDDVDPLLNHETATHERIVNLTRNAERVMVLNATTIQTKLEQLHAALMPAGAFEVFGSLPAFERDFVRKEFSREISPSGRVFTREITVGYRQGDKLKRLLAPMVLRRSYEDLTDVRMPTLMPPENVWLDLHPAQRERYNELQRGVVRMRKESGEVLRHAEAWAKVTYGQQICSGLAALGDPDVPAGGRGQATSVKLDWLVQAVQGPWAGRKVVAFIKNLGTVAAAEARFAALGIGTAKVWGPDNKAEHREGEITRFWTDPSCRVLLGTSAIERSLNLQAANILVNVDSLANPARMVQLAGRIRRAGSAHQHVWIFNLFTRETQEERTLPVLERRQAVADFVWEESSDLYRPLSSLELLALIVP